MRSVLAAHLTQHIEMLRQLLDITAFFSMRNGDRPVTDLYMGNAVIFEDAI
jgi:hypothetical protein